MTYQNSSCDGENMGGGNVDKTPILGIPVLFSSQSYRNQAVNTVDNYLLDGGKTMNGGSIIPTSSNDEGGSYGGCASGTFMGKVECARESSTFIVGGRGATANSYTCFTNSRNATANGIKNSQNKVEMLCG